uniref:Carbonic anhydrase n=1 Tax=Anopheles epiroticus TaxID=199890 RepID=A0A182PA32_9DIPT
MGRQQCLGYYLYGALLVIAASVTLVRGDFSYDDPDRWADTDPDCGGMRQSPIDIVPTAATLPPIDHAAPLLLEGGSRKPVSIVVTNNGHTAQYTFRWSKDSERPTLVGGPLPFGAPYVLEQLHFHWGADNGRGSEHTFDGVASAAEAHFVFYKLEYGTFEQAVAHPDGLAVVGTLYAVGDEKVKPGAKWARPLPKIRQSGSSITLDGGEVFSLDSVAPGGSWLRYYSYAGSLTTPPCAESVTWIVRDGTSPIAQKDLDELRNLRDSRDQPLVDNYRPVQPLNGRPVNSLKIKCLGVPPMCAGEARMSALCLSLLLACQPFVYARGYAQEDGWHPNDVSYDSTDVKAVGRSSPPWTYSINDAVGPANWPIVAPACGGQFQSPININTSRALVVKRKVPLQVYGLKNWPLGITAENEGFSVKFTPRWGLRSRPRMRGGPLKTTYLFEQMHFHWGPNNTEGSEHTINGQRFPLEVHLVFYNGLYPSIAEAAAEVDGLAVIGFFYDVVPGSSSFSNNPWSNFLPQLRQPRSKFTIPITRSFTLHEVVGSLGWSFYSYDGSLTTPPCLETVNWIVSTKRLSATELDMSRLRSLTASDGRPMVLNYRPVQPQNTRRVFLY